MGKNTLDVSHPKIAKQWHPERNGNLKASDFTYGSNQKVWWKCPEGEDHQWEARIAVRSRGTECPFCTGNKVSIDTNLLAINPELAKEWHPTKNGTLQPSDFTTRSEKKIWWKCPRGDDHVWKTRIADRSAGTGCPFCSGKKVSKDNNLLSLRPELAKEWHPTKNGNLKPSDFTVGSGQKVWWRCSKEFTHEWEAEINSRNKGRNCPKCSHHTSEPELRIFAELNYVFNNVKTRYKIDNVEADIFLPEFKIAIEYDGEYYHRGKLKRDKKKNSFFNSLGIKIIRVRQKPLRKIADHDIEIKSDPVTKENLNSLMGVISQLIPKKFSKEIDSYVSNKGFLNEKLHKKYLSFFPNPFPERSLDFLFPELIKEWHPTKNGSLQPSSFTSGSGKKVWWKCSKGDDHEWEAKIHERSKGRGCPFCAGKKISKNNNLLLLHPELAKEWHPTKNGNLQPSDFTTGSSKKVWWKCPKGNDHEWEAYIKVRSKGHGCPFCCGKKVSKDNNLLVLYPELSKEWHPTKNGSLQPSDFTSGSGKKVWWKCSKCDDHEWEARIADRAEGHGCPFCSGRKFSKYNNQS